MSKSQDIVNKRNPNTKTTKASITKRVVLRAAGKGIRAASDQAMKTAGYVVKVEDGWVIEVDSKGQSKRVKKLGNTSTDLVLD